MASEMDNIAIASEMGISICVRAAMLALGAGYAGDNGQARSSCFGRTRAAPNERIGKSVYRIKQTGERP
jgi:hypothetical protein